MKKSIIFALLGVCLLMFCACKQTDDTLNGSLVTISTPFADLKVTDTFDRDVSHEVTNKEPYTLTFKTKADNTELFSLIFNGDGDVLMGTLLGEKENTVIYMNIAELDKNAENYDKYIAYQDGTNDILNGLIDDYNFVVNEIVEYEDTTTFDIKTSVVTLKYPNKWKEKVQIEVTKDGVKFANNNTPLFDLVFDECDGYLLGTYKDTPIYIVSYPAQSDEQAAMQEDVNVILQHLTEDSDFIVNK